MRAWGERGTSRVLFAEEGRYGQVLLALEAFPKQTQRTPPEAIDLAELRLRDCRARSCAAREEQGGRDDRAIERRR